MKPNNKTTNILKKYFVQRNSVLEKKILKDKGKDIRVYEMNWTSFGCCIGGMCDQIDASGYKPDVIVCIMTGAERVVHALSMYFPDTLVVRVWIKRTVDDGVAATKSPPKIYDQDEDFTRLVKGKKVLIVDDVLKFGKTLEHCVAFVKNHQTKEIKTATLVTSTQYADVDFPGVPIDRSDWIVFPWDRGR